MAAYILHIPPTKILISNRSQKKTQEPHKRAYLSENGRSGNKKSGEWAKKQKRVRQKEQQD